MDCGWKGRSAVELPSRITDVKATCIVILDREVDGRVIASVPGIPGCHSYGRTPSEAIRRVRSALRFYLKRP